MLGAADADGQGVKNKRQGTTAEEGEMSCGKAGSWFWLRGELSTKPATSPLSVHPSAAVCTPDGLDQARLPPSLSTRSMWWGETESAGMREGREP